jgi:predicted TIM-barrel fold metal-dependent hydrolase
MPLPFRAAAPRVVALLALCLVTVAARPSGAPALVLPDGDTMTVAQVMQMPKIDAHAHVGTLGPGQLDAFVAFLDRHHLQWLNICVGGMNWARLSRQIAQAQELHRAHPAQIAWATSFNLENWSQPDWARAATDTIADGLAHGAVAVKVWKDVGMVLKDPGGQYVMIDDRRMDPLLDGIAGRGTTLVAHLGEPRNCWLPLDEMTTASDRQYFASHPQYHGLLHPEVPGYLRQIAARDAMLERHPKLKVVGCHLGSLEYDVDELAKRLDRYPNFAVDLAARMVHLQIQQREKVRVFLLKYQDRILYGTDLEFGGGTDAAGASTDQALARLLSTYESNAAWLATDQEVVVEQARAGFKSRGLSLPGSVLRKLYYENARRWYPGI